MTSIVDIAQELTLGDAVYLFELDLRPMNRGFDISLYFTPSDNAGVGITFGGIFYESRPINVTGFERSSEAQPPEPTLEMSNVDRGGNILLESYDDLLGAKLIRRMTFSTFLDFLPDGVTVNPTADSGTQTMPEIWFVEQKTEDNPILIQWRLKSILDLDNIVVPAREVHKAICKRLYRTWDADASEFVYASHNACPYAGAAMFKRDGTTTTDPTQDRCSKSYAPCKLRFGDESLPGWFFPGVSKIPGQ